MKRKNKKDLFVGVRGLELDIEEFRVFVCVKVCVILSSAGLSSVYKTDGRERRQKKPFFSMMGWGGCHPSSLCSVGFCGYYDYVGLYGVYFYIPKAKLKKTRKGEFVCKNMTQLFFSSPH